MVTNNNGTMQANCTVGNRKNHFTYWSLTFNLWTFSQGSLYVLILVLQSWTVSLILFFP